MDTSLVTWSGGGRFVGKKNVQSAAVIPLTAGLRVEWSPTDIEILPGTSAQVSQTTTQSTAKWFRYDFIPVGGTSYTTNYYAFDLKDTLITQGSGQDFFRGRYRRLARSNPPITQCGIAGYSLSSLQTIAFIKAGTSVNIVQVGNCNDNSTTTTTVQTNAPATSSRQTATPPTITSVASGWAISITYTDNSTFQIPVTYQPSWVRVGEANSCPPETLRQCDHGSTRCCFGCVNGKLTLIDSFNKV